MVREHSGRKTHKATSSDKFYQEWAAHQAAIAEEGRTFEEIENDDELDQIANDEQGTPVSVIA